MSRDMVAVPAAFTSQHPSRPYLSSLDEYQTIYENSVQDSETFWATQARELLSFETDFHTTHSGSFHHGDNAWFLGGRLNASYNCVDRHAHKDPDRIAIIYEADEPGNAQKMTYGALLREVSRLAWLLQSRGVRKGDVVAIYLPAILQGVIALLACVRIGAVHSVVFAGFSASSLADRILDANCKVVITADEGRRGGKIVATKAITDDALEKCPNVETVIVQRHTGNTVPWQQGRDIWWNDEAPNFPAYFPPASVDAEDLMFLLYTSGSTGKPKGLMHSTAGYLLGAAITGKYVLDIHQEDTYFCTGDLGWITGHTYGLYAPLVRGATIVIYEGTPGYPDCSRYWDIIDAYDVSHFYTAPTTLRYLRGAGSAVVKHKMEKLRLIACVGEPLAAEVWNWVFEIVGKKRVQILDTFFQTESGAHLLSPMGGVTPCKPGSVTMPFFGITPAILDPETGKELVNPNSEGVLVIKHPWPSMARSVWGSHQRYMDTYYRVFDGYYFTGDKAVKDEDGYFWIRGRVDDIINVSAHRLSTAEIEAALLDSSKVTEAAVIGVPDDLTGQAVYAFVSLKQDSTASVQELRDHVRSVIGGFAVPKVIRLVDDLPKTRSGKIMRRLLRKIIAGEIKDLGDTSTLSDSSVVERLITALTRKDSSADVHVEGNLQ